MSKYKIISAVFIMFILFNTTIYAESISGIATSFINVSACYGSIDVLLYANVNVTYQLINCAMISQDKWSCPCNIGNQTEIFMLVNENETVQFNVIYQYYVGELKPVIPYVDGIPTEEEVYNEGLKRVGNFQSDKFYNKIELDRIKKEQELKAQGLMNFLGKFFMYFFGGLIGLIIFISIIIFIKNRLRRWLKLREYEKLTLGGILKKIFSREDINRTGTKPQEQKQIQTSNNKISDTKDITMVTDEIRKLMEDL